MSSLAAFLSFNFNKLYHKYRVLLELIATLTEIRIVAGSSRVFTKAVCVEVIRGSVAAGAIKRL